MFEKRCKECDHPIPKTNRSGICKRCVAKKERKTLTFSQRSGKGNDGQMHKELKTKAAKFLESLGCQDIRQETRALSGTARFIYDVIGFKGTDVFIVECGGSAMRKLLKISQDKYNLYILPYGYDSPFLYEPNMQICRGCGHLTSISD